MKDYFEIDNFLTADDYSLIERNSTKVESCIDPNGVFKGMVRVKQQWFDETTELGKLIRSKLNQIELLRDNRIDGMQVADMLKPYDIHGDYLVQKNQKPISDPSIHNPMYTIIIPLVDGEYHTVVFDQEADYNNFSEYKEKNNELVDYVSNEDWQKYCGHCHDVDQKYLTIKKVLHWRKGSLLALNRKLMHASANFLKPKRALVIWSSKSN
jgi:hypothetical protein|tara:strand:+ start:361 stop:993 length:633 start_codon:yes stop_codon:yes gene_type:complete